jgi:hypothetical protein
VKISLAFQGLMIRLWLKMQACSTSAWLQNGLGITLPHLAVTPRELLFSGKALTLHRVHLTNRGQASPLVERVSTIIHMPGLKIQSLQVPLPNPAQSCHLPTQSQKITSSTGTRRLRQCNARRSLSRTL